MALEGLPERLHDQVEKVRDRTAEAVGADGGSVLRELGRIGRRIDHLDDAVRDRLDGLAATLHETDDRLDDLHAESLATTWPRRLFWLLVGAGAGAVAAYLADPDRGQDRRGEIVDQATSRVRDVKDEVVHRADDVKDQIAASAAHVKEEAQVAAQDVAAEAQVAAQDVATQVQDSAQAVTDEARQDG